jgi:hypothetical protein
MTNTPAPLYLVEPVDLVDQLSHQWRKPTFRDDLADFIDDLRAHPELACVCAAAGFVAGLMLTVGLAYVIGQFL